MRRLAFALFLIFAVAGHAQAAATAVYVSVTRVPLAGVPTENVSFDNISATTTAFALRGGYYAVAVKASTYGTVTLQILGPDDTTYLTVVTAFAADGIVLFQAPPGNYRILIA